MLFSVKNEVRPDLMLFVPLQTHKQHTTTCPLLGHGWDGMGPISPSHINTISPSHRRIHISPSHISTISIFLVFTTSRPDGFPTSVETVSVSPVVPRCQAPESRYLLSPRTTSQGSMVTLAVATHLPYQPGIRHSAQCRCRLKSF